MQRRRLGQLDAPLSAHGRREARLAAVRLREQGIGSIWSSPPGRATSTARCVSLLTELPVQHTPLAREVDHGAFAGLTKAEIDERYPGLRKRRAADKLHWRFPHGESYADALDRADRLIEVLRAAREPRPALVTHQMFARTLMARLLAAAPDEWLEWRLAHGQFVRVPIADVAGS